jgi:phage replication-related protein YjqB (UPF0714/DUF867 family)
MPDKYLNFAALERNERRNIDFCVRSRDLGSRIAVIAPHGGKIEPGTSEVAIAIAGANLSFYAFEGRKPMGNRVLHITSTRFDEPTCLALIATAERVIAIHGEKSEDEVVFLGGLDKVGRTRMRNVIRREGFCVKTHTRRSLQGIGISNICNRGNAQTGIQVELSNGLRRSFFRSLSANGRNEHKPKLREFASAVREALGY